MLLWGPRGKDYVNVSEDSEDRIHSNNIEFDFRALSRSIIAKVKISISLRTYYWSDPSVRLEKLRLERMVKREEF